MSWCAPRDDAVRRPSLHPIGWETGTIAADPRLAEAMQETYSIAQEDEMRAFSKPVGTRLNRKVDAHAAAGAAQLLTW